MGKTKPKKQEKKSSRNSKTDTPTHHLKPETVKSIWAIVFIVLAAIFSLAGFDKAGPVGNWLYGILHALLGIGYFILPLTLLFIAGVFFMEERRKFMGTTLIGAALLILSVLGLIDIFTTNHEGGYLGRVLGAFQYGLGDAASAIINVAVLVAAILMTANVPLRMPSFKRDEEEEDRPSRIKEDVEPVITNASDAPIAKPEKVEKVKEVKAKDEDVDVVVAESKESKKGDHPTPKHFSDEEYVAPPLSLLAMEGGKPTTGDLRANANIIKRTLESFGIPVEMGEINIGPKVTRYTLKPAEGVKLSRITALAQDMALVLAAHPIRIEAPIPGKSLVGIEVPNKTAALVRLGSLMGYKEFHDAGPLGFALGRDVTGEPMFANIEKMPHLLIAGATGSGKSVVVHAILTSLLYKNSPATLRLIMIDPKRVELSIYEGIPHLISPVVTENKKAIGVFRWALAEMDRRYDILLKAGNRDIKSYNAGHKDEPLPFVLIVVDELADLMSTFGKEVEGSIVRLAQMARATGIHLILATQRPSVEVITGLIKANIPARIALQVASQIDSRTILDAGGAEKLLGGGDLLFTSAEFSQPRRIQGSYITEAEINKVAGFIRENNLNPDAGAVHFDAGDNRVEIAAGAAMNAANMFDQFSDGSEGGDDDDLYRQAVETVISAKKASASLLQRRLKVGYARAARLLDLMEERGVIGPGDGAKPREVYAEGVSLEGVSDTGE
jgi:S-DNA-T family DNA segregation ATPase FtsK/SpoIIIE